MRDLRTAAQQALEAWDGGDIEWFKRAYTVMENLRAALAEPVQEPVFNPAPGYCKHCKQYTIEEPLPAEPVQEPASKMTAGRAAYFMARFKREEKMLGPNEQAALDFVISMLEAAQAELVQDHFPDATKMVREPVQEQRERELNEALTERDDAEDYIDADQL